MGRLLGWGLALLLPVQAATPASSPRLKVVLDPGHGGEDVGAEGARGLLEKDLALTLALALKTRLETQGLDVSLTREGDTFLALPDRAKLANERGADLFVSLHFNAARSRGARGSEVYFLSLDQGDEDARAVAATENGDSSGPSAPEDVVAGILDDLAQKAFLQESQGLAVSIQGQLNRLGGIKERGVKQAPFAVLRRAAMPAVLVEGGFISNPREALRLKDPAFQERLAQAIARGISRYLATGRPAAKRRALLDP